MDANMTTLIFLMLFVVFFIIDARELAEPTLGEGSELHASDRYAVADQINI